MQIFWNLTNEFDSHPKKPEVPSTAQLTHYQWATRSSLKGEKRKQGRSFVFVISPPAHGDRNVSNALAHKGQIDTKEPGEWEHCGKWLPCGHFEHARPSFHMCRLLLSLSKGDLSPPLSPNKDHRAALTSHPIWWLLKTLCGTLKPLKNTKSTFL